MGAFVAGVVTGLVAGLSAAAPWLVYARRVSPSLARAEARPAAYVVAMFPAVLATLATAARLFGFTTGWFQVDVALIAATIGFACSWSPIAHGALYTTGGPKPMQRDPYAADADDAAGVRGAMRTAAYGLSWLLFATTAMWFVSPAYAALRVCSDAEAILARAEPPPPYEAPLVDSLPYPPPEPGAESMLDFPMDLAQTAESRHDPDTRAQLEDAGFVAAHVRGWLAADSNWIQADVMEFATSEGAAAYQAQVTRHACVYANEAFEAPMGGIGLQVRYGTGAPIVEQISWVAGNRRYLVQVSEYEVPEDHSRILSIHETATVTWPPS